ncbi:hypothetical protein C7212DRAFT_160778, partial [Tuber magnatum]
LLLCMDVKGGYENVAVEKMEERREELSMKRYLRKWVSSFLREREVKVKLGKRKGREWMKVKGGTVQRSPLSPILFMMILGEVMEEGRKEEVESMKMVAVVDDVGFMIEQSNRKWLGERMRKIDRGLRKGLKKYEVDMQIMKLEGMWMGKDRNE